MSSLSPIVFPSLLTLLSLLCIPSLLCSLVSLSPMPCPGLLCFLRLYLVSYILIYMHTWSICMHAFYSLLIMSPYSLLCLSSLLYLVLVLCLSLVYCVCLVYMYLCLVFSICLVSHAFLVSCISLVSMSPCICLVLISCAYLVSYMLTYLMCTLMLSYVCRSPLKHAVLFILHYSCCLFNTLQWAWGVSNQWNGMEYGLNSGMEWYGIYCIRTNIGGYNIWRFVEIMDLARY